MSTPNDTTPIRRDVNPRIVNAPVLYRFEHWGDEWAVTKVDQDRSDGRKEFGKLVTVTHVRSGRCAPIVAQETVSKAVDRFEELADDHSKEWFENQLEDMELLDEKPCPNCNGSGTIPFAPSSE